MGDFDEIASATGRLVPGPVLVADGDGRVRYLSPAAAVIFGIESGQGERPPPRLSSLFPGLDLPGREGEEATAGAVAAGSASVAGPVRVTVRRGSTEAGVIFLALIEERPADPDPELQAAPDRHILDALEEIAGLGIFDWDLTRDRAVWSDRMYRLFGHEPGTVTPSLASFIEFFHPEDRGRAEARISRVLAGSAPARFAGRALRADGTVFRIELEGIVLRDDAGSVRRFYGVVIDATKRREAELDQARLAALMRCSFDGVVLKDEESRIEAFNQAAVQIYGHGRGEVIGRIPEDLIPAAEAREARLIMDQLVAGETEDVLYEATRTRPDGTSRELSISVAAVRDSEARLVGTVAAIRDRSALAADDPGTASPEQDPLTGLLTGAGFSELLAGSLSNGGGSLLHLDLDNLKLINESHGYRAGDWLLRGVAQTLKRASAERWPLGRIGGDEFALLLPESDIAAVEKIVERLLRLIRGHVEPVGEYPVTVTASIGVVSFGGDGPIVAEELLARAQRAVDQAKLRGRDTWVLADDDPLVPVLDHHSGRAWRERIRKMLTGDQCELFLQPIVEIESGDTVSYEALLRVSENGKRRAPGPILAMAERLGLIHAVDRTVMRKALDLMEHNPGLNLAVNISGASLGDDQLLEIIGDAARHHRFDPVGLTIEMTETAAAIDAGRARRFATKLKKIGCGLAIDDFGTGYGSYDYLKNVPVDQVKIDGQFIREWSEVDEVVVASLVGLARGLNKKTVAECVESEEALERVARAGVDLAQGFHLGRPAPAEQVLH